MRQIFDLVDHGFNYTELMTMPLTRRFHFHKMLERKIAVMKGESVENKQRGIPPDYMKELNKNK